jgi:hypothetical protein
MKLLYQASIPAKGRFIKAVLAGGLFLGLLVLFLVPPASLPLPACAFHSITGHSCLTCGMTRSLHAIEHGDLIGSVGYHLFGPLVFLALLLFMVLFAAEAIGGRRVTVSAGGNVRNRVIGMFAILWFVYWGVRLTAEFLS